jgi:exopolyphosphatase/guanosine-5'-triphosphate,3'-diphosphate pyrophosphatase
LRETGRLSEDAMRRTLHVVEGYVMAICEFRPGLKTIATSALRRATNSGEFAESVRAITGAPLEIISGEEEARCSYEGAVVGLPAERSYGVLDVGGGSSEYATQDAWVSLEIGAVRLTETFPGLRGVAAGDEVDRARAHARTILNPLHNFKSVDLLILVGGSATTSCAVISGGWAEFPSMPLGRDALRAFIERLASLPLEKRRELPGMVAQRADILLAGALVIDEVCAVLGHREALVSTNDLLLGYLLRH